MGADLYIESIEKDEDKGYFRDSYNSTSVLWKFGLSWWTNAVPMLEDGYLSPKACHKLIVMMDIRKEHFDSRLKRILSGEDEHFKDDSKEEREKWVLYFHQKHKKLVEFLERAIKLQEPVYASL